MDTPRARILCTEDDPDTRDVVSLFLSLDGFEVVCANNAQQAIALARNEHFDLYLLDNWMPGLSGDELCRELREFDSTTPVLFYSGAGQEADKAKAMAAGAQGYLVKPAGIEELRSEVVALIG
jgi:DNA-binding response OmpR family regulator